MSTPPTPSASPRLWEYTQRTLPVPRGRVGQFAYGLALPLLGLRVILRDRELRSDAILPVACLIAWCSLWAWFGTPPADAGWWSALGFYVGRGYAALLALAPIPSFLFARHYARMAARARTVEGLGPRDPFPRGFIAAQKKALYKVLLISFGLAPLVLLARLVPWGVGSLLALSLGAAWTLHWMVVTALDGGRSLAPGESAAAAAARQEQRMAWFGRMYQLRGRSTVDDALAPLRLFGRLLARLGHTWTGELNLLEKHPSVTSGFGLGIAAMLAVPGLNFLFRPAVISASACLRGQLEAEVDAALADAGVDAPALAEPVVVDHAGPPALAEPVVVDHAGPPARGGTVLADTSPLAARGGTVLADTSPLATPHLARTDARAQPPKEGTHDSKH
ncbi:MAG: hypothetical protein H6713_03360 [Myxococcales bacterium]|nr:hypothetical protein [Myxococcales bacterium]